MQLSLRGLTAWALFASVVFAEQTWPGSIEYYGYHGPAAPLSSDGRVIDTPEVAHARAAHLATHAEVVAKIAHAGNNEIWQEDDHSAGSYDENIYHPRLPYTGPPAPLGHDGRVIDTAEVAQAKAAHLAAHAQAAAKASPDYDYHGLQNEVWDDRGDVYAEEHPSFRAVYAHHPVPVAYHGPPAPLAPDGRVLDTPEVAKAKEAHLRAHAYAAALAAHRKHEQLHY